MAQVKLTLDNGDKGHVDLIVDSEDLVEIRVNDRLVAGVDARDMEDGGEGPTTIGTWTHLVEGEEDGFEKRIDIRWALRGEEPPRNA